MNPDWKHSTFVCYKNEAEGDRFVVISEEYAYTELVLTLLSQDKVRLEELREKLSLGDIHFYDLGYEEASYLTQTEKADLCIILEVKGNELSVSIEKRGGLFYQEDGFLEFEMSLVS